MCIRDRSVVIKDVPENAVMLGIPAKNVGNNLHSQKGFVFNKLVLKPRDVAKAND